MALEGSLQEFGLADILQLVYFQKKTGILSLEGRADKVKLLFVNGNITGAESRKRLETNRLGKVLVKKGYITQSDLDSIIGLQEKEGGKLGHILLEKGLISREALIEVLHGQIIETVLQLFAWRYGSYEFVTQGIPVEEELPVSLDTQQVLMEGLRIVDEWSLIEGKLDLNTVFKKVSDPLPGQINADEKKVLGLIDGESDVSTLIDVSELDDFETSKALVSLEEKGLIEAIAIEPVITEKAKPEKLSLLPFYLAVFIVSLFVFIFMLRGGVDALKAFKNSDVAMRIERLKAAVDLHYFNAGQFPQSLELITKEKDPWGRPYVYKITEDGFKLYSVGPDGIEGTKDDVF
ncbi:MAG: DUF4388 domain-containing protein [Nitrospirae bacterium]|nr:DUF4388 domain-containing protein [Nitrospirota bacterium]